MIARLFSSLLFTICLAGGAQAGIFWGTVGSNCVPADATIEFNRHKVNPASVEHAPDNIGLIILNCPITRFNTPLTSWRLSLSYRDSTGTGTGAFIRARLYKLENGMFTPVVLGEFNSNDFNVTGSTTRISPPFTHTFRFSVNNYWVRVEFDRSSTSQSVIFHSVVLDGNPM
jgi:hypothetical protein